LLNGNSTITVLAAPYFRPHSSLHRKTPVEEVVKHSAKAPFWDEAEKTYDSTKDKIREKAYWRDKNKETRPREKHSFELLFRAYQVLRNCRTTMDG
jgi:hypothetical protein